MSTTSGGKAPAREILFEFIQMGAYVKVMAVDALTGTEVSIVGPANAPQQQLQNTAMQKLKYILEKQKK